MSNQTLDPGVSLFTHANSFKTFFFFIAHEHSMKSNIKFKTWKVFTSYVAVCRQRPIEQTTKGFSANAQSLLNIKEENVISKRTQAFQINRPWKGGL